MSMSARQRDILLLHALHGFSYEQISEQVGIPLGTVMSRISRARQVLKEFYANDDFDGKVIVPFKKRSLKVAPK
jgi:RNA polymerase sigma-70 factor (ECF subfamily)